MWNKHKPYDNARWRKARARYLHSHPLCVYCKRSGKLTYATVVDHIKPHEGNYDLMWNEDNWQALCQSCHSGIKQVEDYHGRSQSCDKDGLPIDSNHPWAKEGI